MTPPTVSLPSFGAVGTLAITATLSIFGPPFAASCSITTVFGPSERSSVTENSCHAAKLPVSVVGICTVWMPAMIATGRGVPEPLAMRKVSV